jgi:hypothetical protein
MRGIVGRATRRWLPAAENLGFGAGSFLVVPASGQRLYRVVGRTEARLRDFQSPRDLEREPWPDTEFLDHLSLSMFDSEARAEENAVRYPKFVVPVLLVPGLGFNLARVEADIEGHYCVWGDPERLLDQAGPSTRYDDPG